jgi:glycosyltransferase involved in cell wall biosynthesis
MRLTWLSNSPWTATGYGVQTALFGERLVKAGYPLAVISNYGHQGNAINWKGIQIYGNSYHPYCQDIMHSHSHDFKADAMISLVDIQVIEPQGLQGTKWIPWFPVDHITIPPVIFDRLKYSDARITMSKSANAEMDKTGMSYEYVPCAVDTQVYKPLDQLTSREAMQLPLDKFIVGMVAMNKGNPSRKAFHQTIAAFAALQAKHKDCVLYLHTLDGLRGPEMVNLLVFCKALSLKVGYAFTESAKTADVIFADQYGYTLGYDPNMMAQLYSSMDVFSLVTMGEGFGIPIIEAQACGCPVIVSDWTASAELRFSGWKVDKKEAEPIFTPMEAWQFLPHPGAIAERMEAAYQMRGNQDYRHRAVGGAQAYDIDKVFNNYMLPALTRIEEKLKAKSDKSGSIVKGLRL